MVDHFGEFVECHFDGSHPGAQWFNWAYLGAIEGRVVRMKVPRICMDSPRLGASQGVLKGGFKKSRRSSEIHVLVRNHNLDSPFSSIDGLLVVIDDGECFRGL